MQFSNNETNADKVKKFKEYIEKNKNLPLPINETDAEIVEIKADLKKKLAEVFLKDNKE